MRRLSFIAASMAVFYAITCMQPVYGADTGADVERMYLTQPPLVTNLAGEKITELIRDQQAVIEIAGRDITGKTQDFLVVVEVRDGNGFTESLSWQEGTVEPNGDFEMKFSWSPRQTCEFYQDCEKREIRTFVLSSLINPSSLTIIYTTGPITLLGVPTEIPNLNRNYSVLLHDRIYNITYSFHKGSGTITNVDINRQTRTLTLSLETRQNSQLVMAVSKPLFDYTLIGNTTQSVGLYVLVAGNETSFQPTSLDFRNSLVTYVLNIEKGTKEIALVGRLQ